MKLYVARHGQSLANAVGVLAGAEDDSPLTDQGVRDAALLAKNIGVFHGVIVSSPLHRALQTAEYVRDQLLPGAPIRVDESFAERDAGSATDKPRQEYFAMERSKVPIAGAETPEAMVERVRHGLRELKRGYQDTLLITHDMTYRIIVCALQDLPPAAFINVPPLANGEYRAFNL